MGFALGAGPAPGYMVLGRGMVLRGELTLVKRMASGVARGLRGTHGFERSAGAGPPREWVTERGAYCPERT